ncbi:MAG: hypothetical protein DI533_13040 [Cereibacter sphaeroides]|uniref:SH3b domain-containing protein n=1 Tax=Cereibacter sphaeroides TaxID=1063 RepID=A0A2W5S4U1_CERSP|nr:MAG: hypothetical protein DI533_13040 [Cereibacter sphaeroides]
MFKLFTLLCSGIFLTMLLGGRDDGPVRYGLMPGKIPSLVYANPDKPAKTEVAAAPAPEPQVVAQAEPVPAAQPVVQTRQPTETPVDGLVAAAYNNEDAATLGTGLTLALPLVQSGEPAAAADPEPAPQPEAEPFVQYVQGSSVNVRSGPSAETESLAKLGRGEAVLVLPSETPGWSMIRIEGDGVEGYIASRFLGERVEDGLFNSVD